MSSLVRFAVAPIIALALPLNVATAATLNVPQEFKTIQAAIDAANNGDRVLVAPGTYVENINFHGKSITVTSAQGPEQTIIDGGRADTVVTFASGEGRESVLNGFTLRNGRSRDAAPSFSFGGGVSIVSSSPTISGNVHML